MKRQLNGLKTLNTKLNLNTQGTERMEEGRKNDGKITSNLIDGATEQAQNE